MNLKTINTARTSEDDEMTEMAFYKMHELGLLVHCITGGFSYRLAKSEVYESKVKERLYGNDKRVLVIINPEFVKALLDAGVDPSRIDYLLPKKNCVENCPSKYSLYNASVEKKIFDGKGINFIDEFPKINGIDLNYFNWEGVKGMKKKNLPKIVSELSNESFSGYECVFSNPPFSIKKEDSETNNSSSLWDKFGRHAIKSLSATGSAHFITLHIWNGSSKDFLDFANDKIIKVNLSVVKKFKVSAPICSWMAQRKNTGSVNIIARNSDIITIPELTDINYLTCGLHETLDIVRKGWAVKETMKLNRITKIHTRVTKEVADSEYHYPVYTTSFYKIRYANYESAVAYGLETIKSPKIMIGITTDNNPFFDKNGEYATNTNAYILIDTMDNLEIRMKQLQSNFAKFWFWVGRNEKAKSHHGSVHLATMNTFPNIPLTISDDQEIYQWLNLTTEQIAVVEKYAKLADKQTANRDKRNGKESLEG